MSKLLTLKNKISYINSNQKFIIFENGDIEWFFNNVLHREDGPAIEKNNGDKQWYIYGKLHRIDGPALISNQGNHEEWYLNGQLHRTDGPAVKNNNDFAWYLHGELHRENGPAVEYNDGKKEWWFDGKQHRNGGPAIEWPNGKKEWCFNGEKHRIDGPAILFPNGDEEWYFKGYLHNLNGPAINKKNYKEWRIDGNDISEQDFEKLPRNKLGQIHSLEPISHWCVLTHSIAEHYILNGKIYLEKEEFEQEKTLFLKKEVEKNLKISIKKQPLKI